MDLRFQADNSSIYDYEVSPTRDGGIRLKSSCYGTYWTQTDSNSWVMLKQATPTAHDTNTMFLPTILDGNRITLRCLKNGLFCKRYTAFGKESCLATLNSYPDEFSYMEIEEPVISRKIYNIIYHLNDARRYNDKTFALITDDSSNRTQGPLTSSVNLKTTVTNTTVWSASVALKLGFKMNFSRGVPQVTETKYEISAEITGSYSWGNTKTESQEVGTVKTITVPPMSRVKASLMGTRVSYDIPFSYTQRDVLKNGRTDVTQKHDGLFTGNNGYGYSYEVLQLPLE